MKYIAQKDVNKMDRKKKRVDIHNRGKDYIKNLEEARNISGRTQEEADAEAEVDAVFEQDTEDEEDKRSWLDRLLD